MSIVSCTVETCNRPARNKGLCSTHYRWQRFGKELAEIPQRNLDAHDTCTYGECDRPYYGNGLCHAHYQRQRNGRDMDKPIRKLSRPPKGCSAPGCKKVHWAKGYCNTHYDRLRSGQPMDEPVRPRGRISVCTLPGCDDLHATVGYCKRHAHLRLPYNLSQEQMLAVEGRECQICGSTQNPSIDHDHGCCPGDKTCGDCIRDVLCRSCNMGLGQLRDDPNLLKAAIDYLARFGKVVT